MSERYPSAPGYRSGPNAETSKAAADLVARTAKNTIERILARLAVTPSTPEELAAYFAEEGAPALLTSVRARATQAYKLGLIAPSGTFGIGESGKVRVIRWRLTTPEERAVFAAAEACESEKTGGEA